MKLRDEVKQLQRATPKASVYGQLYSSKEELKGAWGSVLLWTLFYSDEGTYMVLHHRFKKSRILTAREWFKWFTSKVPKDERYPVSKDNPLVEMLEHIQHRFVLSGIGQRTSKHWQVAEIIGWVPHVVHVSRHSRVSRKRNKTSKTRRKNG